jgi:ankyrin repeat protein
MKISILILALFFITNQTVYSSINKNAYKAVKNNNFKMLKKLVNRNNVNEKNEDGETILNYSIIMGNLKIVKYLLSINAEFNNKAKISYNFVVKNGKIISFVKVFENNGETGDTPLIIAIKSEKEKIIKLLLNKGAEINLKNNHSNIPLNVAIETNNMNIILFLLKKGANVNPEYKSWNTPLILAIKNENFDVVKLLVENGADVNSKNLNNVTPLIYTVSIFSADSKFSDKRFEIVKYLIKKGAKIEDDLVFMATNAGSIDLINFLLKNGAKLSQKGKKGLSEVELAAKKGCLEILKKYLEIRNDKNDINKALFKSLEKENNDKVIDYLISLKADINYVDENSGKNILIRAIESNNIRLMKRLIKEGANTNFITKYGYTPLMAAVNSLEITEYLVKNKAKVNIYNPKYRQNLLSYAISMGKNNNNVIKFLINNNANTKNALYNSAIKFNKEITEILLSKGVKVNQKFRGETPLTSAVKNITYNFYKFNKNQDIKDTISLLISKGGIIDEKYLESDYVKSYKKLYSFIKNEQKKYSK